MRPNFLNCFISTRRRLRCLFVWGFVCVFFCFVFFCFVRFVLLGFFFGLHIVYIIIAKNYFTFTQYMWMQNRNTYFANRYQQISFLMVRFSQTFTPSRCTFVTHRQLISWQCVITFINPSSSTPDGRNHSKFKHLSMLILFFFIKLMIFKNFKATIALHCVIYCFFIVVNRI